VLALLLIIIFAIMSTFLYARIYSGEAASSVLQAVTQEQLGQLPPQRIVWQKQNENGTYDVGFVYPNQDSTDFAKQIMQIVGTLVVAVVGFYFGQRSVSGERSSEAGEARQ
jgi:hypothetical protein